MEGAGVREHRAVARARRLGGVPMSGTGTGVLMSSVWEMLSWRHLCMRRWKAPVGSVDLKDERKRRATGAHVGAARASVVPGLGAPETSSIQLCPGVGRARACVPSQAQGPGVEPASSHPCVAPQFSWKVGSRSLLTWLAPQVGV